MPLLPHVDRIAASRSTYVYAFRHLAKRHQIGTGRAEDFYGLPDTLRANPAFRSDLFRIAGAALAQTPELSVNDIVVTVALALGGDAFAGTTELDVPDDLLQMFRDGLGIAEPPDAPIGEPRVAEPVEERQSEAPAPAQPLAELPDAAPAPGRAAAVEDAAAVAPVPIEPRLTSMPPPTRVTPRRPILDQALRAEVPEYVEPAPDADAARQIQRLESERAELERRLRRMERRLHLVTRQVESLQRPPTVAGVPPLVQAAEPAVANLPDPAVPEPAAAREAPPEPLESRMGDLMERVRSWSDVLLFAAVLIFAIIVVAVTRSSRSHAAAPPPPRPAPTAAASSDDWIAPGTTSHAGVGAPAGPRAQAEADITNTLGAWAEAFVNNDPSAEASFYAPTVDRYFLRRDVPREYVLRDKQSYRDRGNRIQRYTVSGLDFQFQSPTSAVVTFTKSWSVTGPQQTGYPHTTRSRVWMARLPEGWRITGEQDLRPGGG